MLMKSFTVLVALAAIGLAGSSVWENRGAIQFSHEGGCTAYRLSGCSRSGGCSSAAETAALITAVESDSQATDDKECCPSECCPDSKLSATASPCCEMMRKFADKAAVQTANKKPPKTDEISWE
jgi:hypothetical protein